MARPRRTGNAAKSTGWHCARSIGGCAPNRGRAGRDGAAVSAPARTSRASRRDEVVNTGPAPRSRSQNFLRSRRFGAPLRGGARRRSRKNALSRRRPLNWPADMDRGTPAGSRWRKPIAPNSGCDRASATARVKVVESCNSVSSSNMMMNSPFTKANPRLRAAQAPLLTGLRMSRIFGSAKRQWRLRSIIDDDDLHRLVKRLPMNAVDEPLNAVGPILARNEYRYSGVHRFSRSSIV